MAGPYDSLLTYFYPRPPCGGRHMGPCVNLDGYRFLSTPSVWRATPTTKVKADGVLISIHALRVEGDHCIYG